MKEKIINVPKVELINATITQDEDCYVTVKVESIKQLEDILKIVKQKVRFCDTCGQPMDTGFTDGNKCWCSTDCVEHHLAELYDNWFVVTSNIEGISFETDEGDTGIYYKEWNWREQYDDASGIDLGHMVDSFKEGIKYGVNLMKDPNPISEKEMETYMAEKINEILKGE